MLLGELLDKPFPKKGKGCLQVKVRPVCLSEQPNSVNAICNCDPLSCPLGPADRGWPPSPHFSSPSATATTRCSWDSPASPKALTQLAGRRPKQLLPFSLFVVLSEVLVGDVVRGWLSPRRGWDLCGMMMYSKMENPGAEYLYPGLSRDA